MASGFINPSERNQVVQPAGTMADPPGLEPLVAELFGRAPGIIEQRAEREMAIYQDDRKLAEVVRESHKRCFEGRLVYERNWWRNLLYTLNRQWIVYNTQRGQWVDKRLARHIPRPVTNLVSSGVDAIRAVFASVQLSTIARPIGDSPHALMTAETVDRLEPVLAAEHELTQKERESDFWLIETGNSILHLWWDTKTDGSITLVSFERCLACGRVSDPSEIEGSQGRCPECGNNSFINATDASGKLVQRAIQHGRGCTDVLSPFEIAAPPHATAMEDADELTRIRWRTKEYGEKFYPEKIAKRVNWEKMSPERSLQLLKSLAAQSEIASGPLSGYGTEMTYGEGITEYEVWKKPSKQFPKGLVVRAISSGAGFEIIRNEGEQLPGPLPHWSARGDAIWPWIHIPYSPFGSRFWARSPLDTVIQIQDQVNQVDSLIQLAMSRTANPVWLEPKGAEVKKFTGEPGIVVKYQPVMFGSTGAAKPERVEGSTIPAYVLNYREMKVKDFNDQLGTTDPFKGGKPPGVEAFSAMQLLVERSQTRFTIPLEERGRGRQKWSLVALELERLYGPDERKFAVMGANGAWTFEAFKHANITGDIALVVEDGSQQPKTNLGKRAAVQQLDQMMILDKTDPDVVHTVLRQLGATDLLPRLDRNIKSALREQDQFERWVAGPGSQPMPPDPMMLMEAEVNGLPPPGPQYAVPLPFAVEKWHEHQIHIAQHKKWANSDLAVRIFESRPDLKQVWAQHLVEHEMAEAQDLQFQMMLTAPPEAGGAAGAGQTMTNSNRESGNPSDVPSGAGESAQGRGPE